jgi:hypothetical protein
LDEIGLQDIPINDDPPLLIDIPLLGDDTGDRILSYGEDDREEEHTAPEEFQVNIFETCLKY